MSPPELHRRFLAHAIEILPGDPRLLGVAVAGSWLSGEMDEFSDLDLVIATRDDAFAAVLAERVEIASRLGPLLAGFTGEHVGEPRVLICLYGPPLLHVDLKVVRVSDFAARVEDPEVVWERDGELSAALRTCPARWPPADLQWIEDRFWVWVHYAAAKIGRGELFEAVDFLAFLRTTVLGPLALTKEGKLPRGMRKIERDAPGYVTTFERTLAGHDAGECARAVEAAVGLYRELRDALAAPGLVLRGEAERQACAYLRELADRVGAPAPA